MALVTSRRQRAVAASMGAGVVANVVQQTLAELRRNNQALPGWSEYTKRPKAQSKPKKQHTREKTSAGKLSGGGNLPGPLRTISRAEKRAYVTNASFIMGLSNGATAGTCTASWRLALNSSDATWAWTNYSTKLTQLATMYRHYRLVKAVYTFIPTLPDTNGGVVAMAFDADTNIGAPSTLGEVYNREISVMTAVRGQGTMTWKPFSSKDKDERACQIINTTNNTRNSDAVSYGTVILYSTNSAAATANIGYLKVDLTIAFDEECA